MDVPSARRQECRRSLPPLPLLDLFVMRHPRPPQFPLATGIQTAQLFAVNTPSSQRKATRRDGSRQVAK